MSNTTAEYWDVDGTSLQTHAWNVRSWGAGQQPPPMRGDNVEIPGRAGVLWTPKVADARMVSLEMWVIGASADGVIAAGQKATFRSNLAALRGLLYHPERQVTLTKRWNGGSSSAAALAQYVDGFDLDMGGPARAQFVIDMLLADPYFYSATVDVAGLTVGTHARTFQGQAASPRHTVGFTGPLTNPTIEVKAGSARLSYLAYNGTIASGETLYVAFPDFVVAGSPGGSSPLNVTPAQRWWAVLDPSATSVVVGGSGAGSVAFAYQPAWF